MNRLIITTELKNLWREKLTVAVLSITLIFAALSFYNGYQFSQAQHAVIDIAQQEQLSAIEAAQNSLTQRLSEQGSIKWWEDIYDLRGQAFYLMVNYATKPPLATAPIAVGQADVFPYYFRMLISEKQNVVQQYDYVNPLQLLLGQFDLAFVVIYILPLLIIGLSYNALTQEQQTGQLRILLLQGINPQHLLKNQLLVRLSLVLVPFLLCSNSLLLLSNKDFTIQNSLIFSLIVSLYCLFWSYLAGFIVSKGKSTATNAAILVACWLAFVIIIPATLNTLNGAANPTPSRIHYVDSLREQADSAKKASEKTLAKFFQDHPELASANDNPSDYATKKIATIIAIEQAMHTFDQAFLQIQDQQSQYAQTFKLLSPATLVYSALVDFSGNGLTRQQDFMQAVAQHHQALQQFYKTQIVAASQRGDFTPCRGCNARPTLKDLTVIPQFKNTVNDTSSPPWSLILLVLAIFALSLKTNQRVIQIGSAQSQEVRV
ncbi:DUF3526 domain-containing protein [Pseudoalteromonas sp. MMG013]|uniref:DUF3526 domain-containing protein n=1 Tax=Pseudoalteromonas sp. MMG013 TaxID=2822687 RepID=UPI001B381FD1|nr:DUF3526 domain-containing protein [Pseudoalteromonas sp. MMG013]MBQ4863755.1 DUF3526 domain-containing protein [Pseudoalteromonas sp. MMG013]